MSRDPGTAPTLEYPGGKQQVLHNGTRGEDMGPFIGRSRPPDRRRLGGLALAAPSSAQEWPAARPVKIVVPFSPGGSSDQLARLLAPELATTFGQQFFIENRGGSSGAIGAAQVAKSAPDGYTLVNAGSGPHLTSPAINPNVGYDPLKDFTHIAMVAADSFVLVANPALGAKSIADLVEVGRGRNLTSASPGRRIARPPASSSASSAAPSSTSSTCPRPIPACRTCSATTST